jgi:hypothetical protein
MLLILDFFQLLKKPSTKAISKNKAGWSTGWTTVSTTSSNDSSLLISTLKARNKKPKHPVLN